MVLVLFGLMVRIMLLFVVMSWMVCEFVDYCCICCVLFRLLLIIMLLKLRLLCSIEVMMICEK